MVGGHPVLKPSLCLVAHSQSSQCCMMAPRTRGSAKAPPKRAAKPHQKQPRWLVVACYVGIPLAVAMFFIGCLGIAVILGAPPPPLPPPCRSRCGSS